ncbi:hypothetical protein ROG8370_01290 [Roseovarius gaetbuli]|uniref:Mrr-like domain-containing protein n=1 Tax=Roseovarius gaetbuli TaxID=1356575 RepID=A0A1X6YXX9_9RHOB|nr:restriction endonuclease [Roseovarius gaetbuli]SLN32571.1 hypothetical protein ROG8370_01290 [Roseovarius gaetbuli]
MTRFSSFIASIQRDGNDGRAFELFVKWFLQNDPEWSTQVKSVWLWNDWPEKWGPDTGINLVFEHKNGDIWAVQAKCYDSKYPVSKKDMDTFLSESNRSIINKRLLVTSTDLMSANAIRTCKHQEKPVVRFMLSDFEIAEVDYRATDFWGETGGRGGGWVAAKQCMPWAQDHINANGRR